MFLRSIGNFISEAFKSIFKNGFMTVASIIVVIVCLSLFGTFEIITMNMNYFSQQISDQCQLQVFLQKDLTDEEISAVSDKLSNIQYIKEKTYQTGKELFDNFKKGVDPDKLYAYEGVPDSIMQNSFKIILTDTEYADKAVKQISRIDGVDRVTNKEEAVKFVNTAKKFVNNISIWIVIIFALISIFIISNTIKLTLYSRRKEINIMKYIGAKDYYIRGPFVTEGIIVGLISAAIAFAGTYYSYNAIIASLTSMFKIGDVVKFMKFDDMLITIIASYAAMGIGLGAIGSGVSIRKYLRV